MTHYDSILLSPDAAAAALRNPAWLGPWCDLYEARCRALSEPGNEEFHLWPFMPPPAYEETVGMAIPEGEVWPASFGAARDWLVVVALATGGRAQLVLGKVALDLFHDGTDLVARFGSAEVQFPGDEAQISLRAAGGHLHLAVNGAFLGRLSPDVVPRPQLRAIGGECVLIMAQGLGTSHDTLSDTWPDTWPGTLPDTLIFDAVLAPDHRRLSRERNAYRFAWGLRSLRLSGVAVMAALMSDLAAAIRSQGGASGDFAAQGRDQELRAELAPELAARVVALDRAWRPLHRFTLDAVLGWPRWRPGVGEHPAAGPWDRNSFTNGSLALTVACLGRLLATPRPALHAAIHAKAGAFFAAETELGFSRTLRSRPAGWWVRRSANHGMIMMLTYATAMRLIGAESDPVASQVEGNALAAIEALYADGSFCEGVHYNAFALIHLVPWLALAGRNPKGPAAAVLTRMPGLYDWWSLSINSRGAVFANFGDNQGDEVGTSRISLVPFLRSFARADLGEPVTASGVDVFSPLVAGLPKPPTLPTAGVVLRHYPRNRFALASEIGPEGRRAGLFVIGSKLQSTHNRNHDCTGFAFYAPGIEIRIDGANRQPHRNNAVGLVDAGGRIVTVEGDRDYSGAVQAEMLDEGTALIRAGFAATLPLAGYGPQQVKVERDFVFAPAGPVVLLLRTQVRGAKGMVPFLAFDLRLNSVAGPAPVLSSALGGTNLTLLPTMSRKGLTCFDAPEAVSRPVTFLTWIGLPGADPGPLLARLSRCP